MNFSQAKISHIITHEIGNKLRNENILLSNLIQIIDDNLEKSILNLFYNSFKEEQTLYNFTHNSDLNLNEIYIYSQNIFNNKNNFIDFSQKMAKHLYEYSLHPKISKGELIIVKIDNIQYKNTYINAIGIFKSEKKDSFLTILKDNDSLKIKDNKGINLSKLDKGCLILNHNKDNGYTILNIDNQSKQTDYWMKKFLNIDFFKDDTFKTKNIINLCKKFSDEFISNNYDTNDRISFNNAFINFFEEEEVFEVNNFKQKVFNNQNIKNDFDEYLENNLNSFNLKLNNEFILSKNEIKKEKNKIKNTIKLDTKIELKILLDKDDITKNIEKGFDKEKGMSYYKIYFNEEI